MQKTSHLKPVPTAPETHENAPREQVTPPPPLYQLTLPVHYTAAAANSPALSHIDYPPDSPAAAHTLVAANSSAAGHSLVAGHSPVAVHNPAVVHNPPAADKLVQVVQAALDIPEPETDAQTSQGYKAGSSCCR